MTTIHEPDEDTNPEEAVALLDTDDAVAISIELDTAEKVVFEASRVELNAKTVELGANDVEIEAITYMLEMDQDLKDAELSPPTNDTDSSNTTADDDDADDAPSANQAAKPEDTPDNARTCGTPAGNSNDVTVTTTRIKELNTDDSPTPPRLSNKISKPK
ncbi:MAG: hypothetical protein K9L79_09395 [Methylobacter tundripaludum]|nr:hypothetical protein [Methylobacter tundripaludum]